MATTATLAQWCATCGSDVTFEQPECADEHGADCPEWVCVRCGEAFLVAFALPERVARPGRHVA